MIRRFGEPALAGQTYQMRAGVYALLPLGRSLLVTYQSRPISELQLPGGGIDSGESPLAALHREAMEETGWKIAPIRRVGAFRRFTFMPDYDIWAEKICHIYLCQPIRQLRQPSEPYHTVEFIPIDKAPKMLGNTGDRYFASLL